MNITGPSVLIIGAGHAGFQLAHYLRDASFQGAITLVDQQPGLPYQRPPLSKAYIDVQGPLIDVGFRHHEFYRSREISLVEGRAARIDRENHTVHLASGATIDYDFLVIATGAVNRVPPITGLENESVMPLRTLPDAALVRYRLASSKGLVVIGGGFIGLEVAAAAAKKNVPVTLVEADVRLMSRIVSLEISKHFATLHRLNGVDIRLGTAALGIRRKTTQGESAVELTDGSDVAADLVVYGIGVLPETGLAEEAGLAVDNGIVVDEYLMTNDPSIFAIGDVASFPFGNGRRRLETVQNAADQARLVARRISGEPPQPFHVTPWFWSEQYKSKLQIAGIRSGNEQTVTVGTPAAFSILHFTDDCRLAAVESVNRPADHVAARRLISVGGTLDPVVARASDFQLAKHAATSAS